MKKQAFCMCGVDDFVITRINRASVVAQVNNKQWGNVTCYITTRLFNKLLAKRGEKFRCYLVSDEERNGCPILWLEAELQSRF